MRPSLMKPCLDIKHIVPSAKSNFSGSLMVLRDLMLRVSFSIMFKSGYVGWMSYE